MRNIVILAAPLAILASPAWAQSAPVTGTVLIDGSVATRCAFTLDNAVIHLGELSLQTTGSTAGKLDTSKVNGKTATLSGWCNGGDADISVEAFPLLNPASGATGFDKRVDFTATASAGSASPTDTTLTAGSGSPANVGTLFNGNILVTLSAASSPTNGIMIAGEYDGSVVVTITPNVVQVVD